MKKDFLTSTVPNKRHEQHKAEQDWRDIQNHLPVRLVGGRQHLLTFRFRRIFCDSNQKEIVECNYESGVG